MIDLLLWFLRLAMIVAGLGGYLVYSVLHQYDFSALWLLAPVAAVGALALWALADREPPRQHMTREEWTAKY